MALNPPPEGGHSALRLDCSVFAQPSLLPEEGREEQVLMPRACPSGDDVDSALQAQLLLQVLS